MHRLCPRLAIIVLAIGAVATPAAASSTPWTPIGLSGGAVYGVAVDPASPSTVYPSTVGGAYRSVDSGATWSLRSKGLTASELTRIVVAPSDHLSIYAGTTLPASLDLRMAAPRGPRAHPA